MTFPIVLAHGIARFDFLGRQLDLLDGEEDADDQKHYFRRIRSTLVAAGFDVHHSDVPFAESVAARARELRQNVERVLVRTGAARVHIIAHSMGGLDARHMLFDGRHEGFHDKVASLTTIGTPHLGTSFADWGIRHSRELFQLFEFAGIDTLAGFADLTTDACREFDTKAEAFESGCGVRFQTVAGTQEIGLIFAPLQFSWFVIHGSEGANDGLVPLASARWRDAFVFREIDADHLNQVGWWDPNELGRRFFPSLSAARRSRKDIEGGIRALYVEIAHDLAQRFP